jgi:hypothetical protein
MGRIGTTARLAGLAVLLAGCSGGTDLVDGTTFEVGTYTATLFRITPDGGTITDVLAAGGSLHITFDRTGATSGTLIIPAGITGAAVNASMAGTATITGLTVTFSQSADTFVRQATWSRIGRTIQLANYRIGSAVYDVSLER